MGPVMCCWYTYWNTAPGPNDGGDKDFLAWFLSHVHDHDQQAGGRTLDVVDVHYYPQSDVFNDKDDPETNASGSAALARCGTRLHRRVVDQHPDRVHSPHEGHHRQELPRTPRSASRSGTSAPTAR